jgi:hypothetical protein
MTRDRARRKERCAGAAKLAALVLASGLALPPAAQAESPAVAPLESPAAAPAERSAAPRAVLQAPDLPRTTAAPQPAAGAAWRDAAGDDHRRRDAARRASVPADPPLASRVATDPERDREWRERGEREREARRTRGGLAPPPQPIPRIGADPPTGLAAPPVPRIAIPRPGEPGGPPIALPTCGPGGCFDANGRPLSGSGNLLMSPDGRPCVRLGASATC